MSVADDLLWDNQRYVASLAMSDSPMRPGKRIAVLTWIDMRLDLHKILGLEEGAAHVVRNASGVATDDAISMLAISQRLLGTRDHPRQPHQLRNADIQGPRGESANPV